ncbi:hypothetical protein [Helicobacter sp. 23-1045]
MLQKMLKKCAVLVLFVGFGANLSAEDFSDKSSLTIGAYGNFGATMGVGVDFGFTIYSSDSLWQVRNIISMEYKGLKLQGGAYDSSALIFNEKVAFALLLGSSVSAHIDFSFFRPYLYVSGGFGLLGAKNSPMGNAPFYYEVQGGLGHEFITLGGHTLFFEIGGGISNITYPLPNQSKNATLGGMVKTIVGYRLHF